MSADARLEAPEGSARRNPASGTVEPGPSMTVDQAKALLQREGLSVKRKEKGKRRKKEKRSGKDGRGKKEKRGKKKRRRRDGSDSGDSSSDDSSDSGSSDDDRRGRKKKQKSRRWNAASFADAREDGDGDDWGPPPGPDARVEPVSEDDYYLKNREFSVWLKHERSVYFTDLLAADARAAFKDFVKAWNARALPATFYKEGGVSASGRR